MNTTAPIKNVFKWITTFYNPYYQVELKYSHSKLLFSEGKFAMALIMLN